MAESDKIDGLVQPRLLPCVTTICSAIMAIMKVRTPTRSNLLEVCCSALLSGVPFIKAMPSSAITTEAKKIQRQPKFCVIKPPKSEQKPEPPHEPIDHMLTARWRASPSQKVLTSARLAGMMQAPDKPCSVRPKQQEI